KNLIENEKLMLFEAQNQYYIHDIIPNYSEDIDDMEIFYSIPNDIGNYIDKLANQNSSIFSSLPEYSSDFRMIA
ncbi:MAG: hypothetical protein K2I96_05935, partial [Lachnospiraceae bacterium]|nr:hypothetical protein [Lachnospiraceae bacterium]